MWFPRFGTGRQRLDEVIVVSVDTHIFARFLRVLELGSRRDSHNTHQQSEYGVTPVVVVVVVGPGGVQGVLDPVAVQLGSLVSGYIHLIAIISSI